MAKFSPDEYRHESNAVSLLNYHFVFIPKRRKKVLVGSIAERLQQIICELVIENRWKIIAMEIMPDHVHLFLNVKPTDDPSSIMRKIKGRASHHLRKEFPELLKIPTLWTPSYFVSTAGNICTETVKKYIEQQRD
ncbi:MAG: IS200/IS605 family transposase [Dolichospermum sp. JUN01]|jgi:putative transposase|uniref:IS200/IS605 family transposase n=1 Tax=Dolichospermum flos-aquae CCAP 1403/13F TaxID=315271 RepID=A0A6H2BW88_DOLFA|nr:MULTISPECIES: IS200/IS605 family transposase [Aphanizomenonaceae]MBO1056938.1 IS200/IS605 family transposase [Dolichospermum sp. JUN01]MDK2412762.1 IS200/IS605 family transposase [Aphanizomenon sp. 202]MDK2462798.1 IS200/IS605 family transposase [Aphanizomenon sp. PH219]OBQ31848.1 MAG: transposase [Anabaena sp. MDT14b]QSV53437.1 MAG: IS200/IS605 family transposase [Dolichospermum sp. UKL201]